MAGWDVLIGRMRWWLWFLTVATIVASAFPMVLHRTRLAIEMVSGPVVGWRSPWPG